MRVLAISKKLSIAVGILVATLSSEAWSQLAVLQSRPTTSNPVMDGEARSGEWSAAGVTPDGFGLAGATYAMWREGLNYDDWSYSGNFSFLLHNIEQNTTYSNGASGQSPAFNVFDIYGSASDQFKDLEITVYYDGFTVVKFDESGVQEGSKSFRYGVDLAPEQTADYDWDAYWGVYARGGFNNSAFTSGLQGAVDNQNQLFEVAVRSVDGIVTARRSVKDPDQLKNWDLVLYNDLIIEAVPEPSTYLLLIAGAGLMGCAIKKRRQI